MTPARIGLTSIRLHRWPAVAFAAAALLVLAGSTAGAASVTSSGPPVSIAPPSVAGIPRAGETLSATPGEWAGSLPISYAYQWQRCGPGYAGIVTSRAPLGYWRLGEASGSTAADSSGRGHSGSYGGSFALGQAGALALDDNRAVRLGSSSSSGSVSIPHRSALSYGDAVTYEAWVRMLRLPSSGSSGADLATKGSGTLLVRILPSGAVALRRAGGSEITRSTRSLAVDGAFHHLVAVKAGTQVRIYLDGADVTGSVANQTLTNSSSSLTIAASGIEAQVDEFAVYGRALSAAEVAADHAAGLDGVCAAVPGATGETYDLDAADVGNPLRVEVTAANADGSGSALSAPTAPVAPPVAPANTAPPTVSGIARQGETLTATTGTWDGTRPIDHAYRWRRCGSGYAGVVAAAAPIGYWRLGEASGTSATDASGRGHHGSYSGSYALGQAGAPALDANTAVRLGGASTGSMSVPHRSTLSYGNAVTYEGWVRLLSLPSSSTSGSNLVTKGSGTLLLRLLPTGQLSLRKSGGSEITRSTVALSVDGAFHHVVGVKASSLVRIYVDGVDVTGSVSNTSLENSSSSLTLAASGVQVHVDELAVYNRGLSAGEVAAAYAAGRDGVCEEIAGANDSSYELVAEDVGSVLRVEVTASNMVGSATAVSDATDVVAPPTAPVNTQLPAVTGVARQGETLTASTGAWSGTKPISYAYEWRRCNAAGGACAAIAGAAASSYLLAAADVGATIRAAVTASNAGGSATAVSPATAAVAAAVTPPANAAPPEVAGEPRVGETLSGSAGSWSGNEPISFAYQWRRCGTGYADLVLAASPIGYWRLGESSGSTARDSSGLGHAGSYGGGFALGAPGALESDNDPAVSVSSVSPGGTVIVPHRPSLNYADAVTYEAWVSLRSLPSASTVGANIATKSTGSLVLRILPSGLLSVRKSGGSELTRSTQPLVAGAGYQHVVAVKAGPTVRVYIDGADVTGSVVLETLANNTTQLTIAGNNPTENRDGIDGFLDEFALYDRGLSPAEVAAHYAAGRDGVCTPIAGATGESYVVDADDEGSALQLEVTGSNAAGSARAISAVTDPVEPAPAEPTAPESTAPPAVTGTPAVGETLAADPGSWSGTEPIGLAYRWQRCDGAGADCADVDGATETTYLLEAADAGATLRVSVTASNAAGTATAVSEPTAPVTEPDPDPPATAPENAVPPEIAGTAAVGETLTASPGSWSGTEPISYAYQWRRCGSGYAGLVSQSAPIGYWRLGDVSGSTAADSSGLGHDGTYAGSVALGEAGALALDANRAVRIGWTTPSGTVTVAHRSSLNVGDAVTYEAWVRLLRLPTGSVGANIATKSSGSLVFRILTSGVLSVRKSSGSELRRSTTALAADGRYHHVVAAKAGSDVRVYVDGIDVTGPTLANETLTNNTTQLTIAGNNVAEGRDGIDGYLDEFALYNRALTAAEVAEHYAAALEGTCSPIAGATDATYLVASGDAGSALGVEVTASNAAGSATAASAPTAFVSASVSAPVNASPPNVAGTLQAGQTLTASPGTWTGSEPIAYEYQWRRCAADGGDCSDVAGATGVTYTLAAGDMGLRFRVAVTGSNSAGSATAVSGATAAVAIGYAGPSSLGVAGERPTGNKPQSKLWWNDGSWWVSMWSTGGGTSSIFRLDGATQTWIDSGTPIDARPNTRADTLWDGTHLYVASHVLSSCGCSTPDAGQPTRLYRYSYDGSSYSLDEGFPVAINGVSSETLVLDKDSTGTLWATWVQGSHVYVNRTTGDDRTWGTPFALAFQQAQSLTGDDISSVVAFGGDSVGILWSNQNANTMYFSVHRDGDPDDVWQAPEIALTGTKMVDDHVHLHAVDGRVLVALKTSRDELPGAPQTDPQMMLLDRSAAGGWTAHVAGTVADDHTRPIVLVDEESRTIHLFATAPTTPGGTIYHKTSPLDAVAFPAGLGTPFIRGVGGSGVSLNDATSTKQSVSSTTGIVVVASERPGNRYWHNFLPLG